LQKIQKQKEIYEKTMQEQLNKELMYPEGYLIAKGSVILSTGDNNDNQRTGAFPFGTNPSEKKKGLDSNPLYPYGYAEATEISPDYDTDDAPLFIVAVGREGHALAAKKIPLKNLVFPYTFELTVDDLLFPYNKEVWMKSGASKDSIATTAIISSANRLSISTGTERFGFGVSDPIIFAGKLSRSATQMKIAGKVLKVEYRENERALLEAIDRQIEQHQQLQQQLQPQSNL
jgi:hypothetical protein